jgi:hypothetical protein
MASPFRTFRKNQKLWMAGITIMAIIAFVFLGNMQNLSRMSGREAVQIQTKYGSLTQSQIVNLRAQRRSLISFLTILRANLGSNQQAYGVTSRVYERIGPETEDVAIERWLYARTAESMGVVIDDKAVNDLLTQMLIGLSSDPQKLIMDVLRAVPGRMTQAQLMAIMREQLLAIRLMQLGHEYDDWASSTATLGERWDYFKRFHQKASAEVAVLSPSKYLNDKSVKEPTTDELKQFFDKYKEVESSPESPQPGFRVPRKANIEYLEAYPENYESQVTEADITKEYEKDPKKYARDKEEFEKQEKEERDAREKEDKDAAAAKAAAEKKPGTDSKTKEPTPPAKPESNAKTGPAAKPEAKSDTTSKATPAASPQPKPAAGSDTKPAPAPTAGTAAPAKPASTGAKPSGSSFAAPSSPFRLVAYVDDKPADKTPSSTAVGPKVADDKKAATESTVGTTPGVKPTPTDDKKHAEATKPADVNRAGEAKPAETKSAADAVKDDADKKKEERKPIKTAEERLRDFIRKNLAAEKYQETEAKVRAKLDAYRTDWLSAGDEKPKPPDFAALAKKYNMTAHRTGLVSQKELTETDFGKSELIDQEARRLVGVDGEVFGPTTLYKVDVSHDFGSVLGKKRDYYFWKTEDQAGGVPKWEDKGVEDKVRQAWKLVQARTPAMDAAKDLKKKADEDLKRKESSSKYTGKTLKELAADNKQIEVGKVPPFTWMTMDMLKGQPAISEVGDLQSPGENFMQTVFGMTPGQVAIATNPAKSEVYVIRMISLTPFKDLWEKFTSEDTSQQEYLYAMHQALQREVLPAWQAKIKRDADFKDLRKKDEKKGSNGQSAPPMSAPEGPPPPEEY